MSTGYEGGFTRRQELTCTETEMAAYADVVLYENEHIYIKMNSGMIRLKIGDGKTGLLNLPWAKVFDATLDDVEVIVGGFASRVETNTKRIENLEAAVSPEIVTPVTDSTMAYAKTVPKGALPNAAITEIGGMSYVKNGVLVDSKVTAVESVGANLIPYTPRTVTHNGITYTVNADGSVTANGTATGRSFFFIRNNSLLSKGTYTLSGCPSGGTGSTYCLYAVLDNTDYSTIKGDMGNGSSFTLNEDRYLAIHINISNGFTARNLTFKPMLNRGSTALPFSPYFRESLPIPADALDGFGQGVNAQYCNKIVIDPLEGVKKYVRNFNKIKFKDMTWRISNSPYLFFAEPIGKGAIKRTASITEIPNMVIEKYTPNGSYYVVGAGTKTDKTICVYEGYLYVYDKSHSTVDAFLAASGDVELIYELATPTETDVSAYFTEDNLLRVVPGGTITAANEFEHEVPFTVEYMIKGA